ncbi:tRNA wybutosine-synthesizing protein 3 homolog isoform X1 [Pezoporus wallicus]|uniref:tRNA wybutosine-synthesizing protein 3 homolog isoform X1 n=1 Tax=Pezoporus wallicus TaxID=35540 RepID=UPI002550BC75|nr:tRNA wybutosine-synthesizing protein 3 homolog isoform X1 [Pezoporus wallicus]
MAAFVQRKAQRLARADASRKGGLDERAAAVVQLLNGRSRFCTTSSCSGRLVLAQGGAADAQSCGIQKTNCAWLLVTHETCAKEDVMTALEKATGDAVLKFEPFVLHVLCQELQDAQLLHSVAVNSGFRNSGITVGRGGKIMMAVRSTHCLEVPLSHKGKLMVSEEYMEFLIDVANRKMEENTRRIDSCLLLDSTNAWSWPWKLPPVQTPHLRRWGRATPCTLAGEGERPFSNKKHTPPQRTTVKNQVLQMMQKPILVFLLNS